MRKLDAERAPAPQIAPVEHSLGIAERWKSAVRVSLLVAGLLVAPGHDTDAAQKQTVARTAELPGWAEKLGVSAEDVARASRTLDEVLRSPIIRAKAPELLQHRDLLFALMIRECALRLRAVSRSNARGYFQMTPIALQQIRNVYDLDREDVDLTDPKMDVAAGLLYLAWTHAQVERLFPEEHDEHGQMMLTLMGHNGGMRYLQTLREEGDTYEHFAQRASHLLFQTVGGEQRNALREVHPDYGVPYRALPGIKRYQDLRKKKRVHGSIKGNAVSIVGDGLEYAELINGIAVQMRAHAPAWVRGGTSVEVISTHRYVYSMARDVANHLAGNVRGFNQSDMRGDHTVRDAWIKRVAQVIYIHNGIREDQQALGMRIEIPPMRIFQEALEVKPRR